MILFFTLFYISSAVSEQHFYFVQISDTHIGKSNNLKRTMKVVESINKLPFALQCVVHTGDIFHGSSDEDRRAAKKVFNQLNCPIHFVPGNHDVKLMRALRGRPVRVAHGLAESLEQLEALRSETIERIDDLPLGEQAGEQQPGPVAGGLFRRLRFLLGW